MKKTTMILLVAGLLVGAAAGIAFAFGGTDEVDVTGDEGVMNGDVNETPVNDANDADANDADANQADANEADAAGDADQVLIDEWDVPDNDYNAMIADYFSIAGTVVSVEEIDNIIRVTIEDENGNPAVLVLNENTVYPFSDEPGVGETVTGWYVTVAPMIAIWPPEYNIAVLVAGAPEGGNLKVDRFNTWADGEEGYMLSQDGMFAFRTDENTQVILANGDDFTGGDIEGRRIVVIYDISTRSIPEFATASRLIVLYEDAVTLPIDIDADFEG